MRGKTVIFVAPEKICKYHIKEYTGCYNFDNNPDRCKECSHNPYKYDGKPMTKGQFIFLTSNGYFTEEEIKDWDFKRAYQEISKLKG